MSVRAKMRCTQVSSNFYQSHKDGKSITHEQKVVRLQPIYETEGPNRKWCEATPSGQLELAIDVPEAAK